MLQSFIDPVKRKESGEGREARFNLTLHILQPKRPWWYLGTYQPPVFYDMRGIDFIAKVIYIDQLVEVPVQIKGYIGEFASYYKTHPYARGKVVEMALGPQKYCEAAEVADIYINTLADVRDQQVDYKEYWHAVSTRAMGRATASNIKLGLDEARRLRPITTPPLAEPPAWVRA